MTKKKTLQNPVTWRWITAAGLCLTLLAGIVVSESAKAQSVKHDERPVTTLAKYTTDLTSAAEQGRFNSIEVPAANIDRAIEILSSHRKNNPVVIGDTQSVRDMVIIGVAVRLATGNVPEELKAAHLYKLNLNGLFKESRNAEELNNKLAEILTELSTVDAKSILIIDPIQSLVGPSGAFNGTAPAVLPGALHDERVHCFGASSQAAFDQNVANQESLASYFATVQADEATTAANEESNEKENKNGKEFVGENVPPDLRELVSSAPATTRVKAILQVDDTNSSKLRQQLETSGVKIDSQMARLGILSVDRKSTRLNSSHTDISR